MALKYTQYTGYFEFQTQNHKSCFTDAVNIYIYIYIQGVLKNRPLGPLIKVQTVVFLGYPVYKYIYIIYFSFLVVVTSC